MDGFFVSFQFNFEVFQFFLTVFYIWCPLKFDKCLPIHILGYLLDIPGGNQASKIGNGWTPNIAELSLPLSGVSRRIWKAHRCSFGKQIVLWSDNSEL